MGGVDGDDAAVGGADAVTALPAGEAQRLGDAGAGAGGVRPRGVVGQRLAGDLLRRVAEEFLGVVVPGGDGALAVDLDDRDADPLVGEGQQFGGDRGAGGAGADLALGQIQPEPDVLVRGGVLDAPAGGERRAELEAAAALAVRAAHRHPAGLERDLALGIAVGDLDAHAVAGAQADHLGGGARVHDGVGDQLAGEDHGVVHDVAEAPALQGVADEGAGGRHRAPDRFEGVGGPRRDHRTPRAVVGGVQAPVVGVLGPGCRGLFPGQRQSHSSGRPSDARTYVCHRPGRAYRGGWTAWCQVTYLHGPGGCRSRGFGPEGVRTVCEAAELLWPGSAGVKHWERSWQRPGQTCSTSTLAGGTRWSLAQRRGARPRADRAGGPEVPPGEGRSRWTRPSSSA